MDLIDSDEVIKTVKDLRQKVETHTGTKPVRTVNRISTGSYTMHEKLDVLMHNQFIIMGALQCRGEGMFLE